MLEKAFWLVSHLVCCLLLAAALWPKDEPEKSSTLLAAPLVQVPVQVAVLNGCGEDQVAARLTKQVRTLGFDVIHEGNADSFNYLNTLVIDRSGDLDKARQVAAALGIPHYLQQVNVDSFHLEEVSIIIGKNHRQLKLLEN